MEHEETADAPSGLSPEAGVWPPQPSIAPPAVGLPLFVSPVSLSRGAMTLMGVGVGCDVIGLLIGTPSPAGGTAVAAGLIGLLAVFVSLASNILFFMWTYRVYKNLGALGTQGLRFTPGWAVGYFFVPILGLYRPYQVFREIWRATDPAPAARAGQDWQFVRTPVLLLGWWLSWIIAGLVATLNATQPQADGTLFAHVLNALAGILGILVVRRITARQDRLTASGAG